MLNAEKFKEKILEISNNADIVAIKKGTVEPIGCASVSCSSCAFYTNDCNVERTKWLCSECVESKEYPVLTRFGKELLERFATEYSHIARDKEGEVYVFARKPKKTSSAFVLGDAGSFYRLSKSIDVFPFVKWEDEEAWSIKELILNCKVE